MAVIAHREVGPPEGSFRAREARTYTRVFHVDIGDRTKDGPATIWKYFREHPDPDTQLFFGKLYKFGGEGTFEFDSAYLDSVDFARLSDADDDMTYVVTLGYGPPVGADPLALSVPGGGFEPYEIDIDYAQHEEIVERDIYGRPVMNSAKDPYNPGITRDDSRYIVTVTRNEAFPNFSLWTSVRDSVNKYEFLGCKPRCVKAKPPRARRAWNNDTGYYWPVTYQFEIRDVEYRLPPEGAGAGYWDPGTDLPPGEGELIGQGWDKVVLDSGFRYLSGNERKQIVIDGVAAQDPVPLDGDGNRLDPDDPPVYRVFRIYPEFDFNELGLGL